MAILKEEGPNNVLFQEDDVPPHFCGAVSDFESFCDTQLSGWLIHLTLHPFFLLGILKGCCFVYG